MRIIILLLLVASSVAIACPSGGGDTIKVSGLVSLETIPGPPNYESIENGDRPEKYWILNLENPMCFSPDTDFMGSEVTLSKMQLLLYKIKGKIKLEEGVKYEFIGATVPSHTGHHRTKVMLEVESYNRL